MKKHNVLFGFLIFIYLFLSLIIKPDPDTLSTFNITDTEARLLSITITIPLILIWSAAYYGFRKIKRYANTIKEDEDGRGLSKLSIGLGILAFGYPISSIISQLNTYYLRSNPQYTQETEVFNLYVNIFLTLAATIFIYQGAKMLAGLSGIHGSKVRNLATIVILPVLFIFLLVLNSDPANGLSEFKDGELVYTTMGLILNVIKAGMQLIAWYLGLMAALYLFEYSHHIKGIIYKKALKYLVFGTATVVVSNIIIRGLSNVSLEDRSLEFILAFIYFILVIFALGYILIAIGANNLKKLENI